MECEEEVQICDICGHCGYDDELAICGRCNDSAEHIYCMATMLDSVPLQWVCERCELEEKKSTANPFSCSEAQNVVTMPKSLSQVGSNIFLGQDYQPDSSSPTSPGLTNKGLSEIQTQTHNKEKSNLCPMQMPAGKPCCSTPKPEGGAVKAMGLSASFLSTACKVSSKENLNVTGKELKQSKSLADGPLSGSKRPFSRSSSFPVGDDQLTFLLPSRPKDFKRSKSTVVRPTATWTDSSNIKCSSSNIKSSKRDEKSTFVKKDGYTKELTHASLRCAMHGASHKVESIKSAPAAGPKVHNQAGEFKRQQHDWSSRDSGTLQFHGRISGYGKEIDFQHSKGSRRCFKCDQVGHVAAQCMYSKSNSPRVCEARKAPASFDKTSTINGSVSETPLSLQKVKQLSSPKKSAQWKSKESIPSFKLASNQTQISEKEGLVTFGDVNLGRQPSPQLCESKSLHDKHTRGQSHSPKGRIDTAGPLQSHADCVQGSAPLQQAQGVSAMSYKQLQGLNNPVSSSNPGNGVGSGALGSREAGLAVDSLSEAQSESLAEPCVQILWSGCFSISSTCLTAYNGMQAHASTKADPRISEAMKSLPFELHLEELKRGVETDTWPRSLQNRPPTSSSIGVYFFPVDMECHDTWYKPLLDRLVANDLALRTSMDFFQLLIFPSHLLPEADQCWDDRRYLWGILQSATLKSSHAASFGDAV